MTHSQEELVHDKRLAKKPKKPGKSKAGPGPLLDGHGIAMPGIPRQKGRKR